MKGWGSHPSRRGKLCSVIYHPQQEQVLRLLINERLAELGGKALFFISSILKQTWRCSPNPTVKEDGNLCRSEISHNTRPAHPIWIALAPKQLDSN